MIVGFNHHGRGPTAILIIILDHDGLGISPTRNHVYDVNYMVIGIIWSLPTLSRSTIEADCINIMHVVEEKTDVDARVVPIIWDVVQPIIKDNTSVEREVISVLKSSWSCCNHMV